MINKYKIVDFANYCPKCKYSSYPEKSDPCNECLEMGANVNTDSPVKFEPKKGGNKKSGKRTRKTR